MNRSKKGSKERREANQKGAAKSVGMKNECDHCARESKKIKGCWVMVEIRGVFVHFHYLLLRIKPFHEAEEKKKETWQSTKIT